MKMASFQTSDSQSLDARNARAKGVTSYESIRLNASIILIIAILLLAAATRILGSNSIPLWTDEGSPLYWAVDPLVTRVNPVHPPLFFIELNVWQAVAGDSRLALRFIAIMGSILTTAVIYRVGKDWVGLTAAIVASTLFAVSDLSIEYGRQIRHYSLLTFGVALMALFFLRYLRNPSDRRLLIPYVLSITFTIYTHYLGFAMLAVHTFTTFVIWKSPWRHKNSLIIAWLVSAVLYLLWPTGIQHIFRIVGERGLAGRPGVSDSSLDTLASVIGLLADHQVALVASLIALATWEIVHRSTAAGVAATSRIFLLLSGVMLFLIMFLVNPLITVLAPRTVVFLTPFVFLVWGYGLRRIQPTIRTPLLITLVIYALFTTTVVQPRYNNAVAAEALAQHYKAGDLIILQTWADDDAFNYEIQRAVGDPAIDVMMTFEDRYRTAPKISDVQAALDRHNRVWIVQWLNNDPKVLTYLQTRESEFTQIFTQQIPIGEEYEDLFPDPFIDLFLFERVEAPN
jgi:hypothetical protein